MAKRDAKLHNGHRQRVRDKIKEGGFSSLFPHEFLEFVLFGAIPRADTNELAHRLLSAFGSVENVFAAPVTALTAVKGIGENAALFIKSYEYASKFVRQSKEKTVILRNLGDLRSYLAPFFEGLAVEEFHTLLLDSSYRLICHNTIKSQLSDKIYIDMEKVIDLIAKYKPSGVIFAHNHPSANVLPSPFDISFTKKYLSAISVAFNASVCDHFIFGTGGECYSFKMSGVLEQIKTDVINEDNCVSVADRLAF